MERFAAVFLTVLGAVLFTIGNIYLHSYYSRIGVSPLEVDYSIQDVLVHSTVVLFGAATNSRILASLIFVSTTFLLIRYGVFADVSNSAPTTLATRARILPASIALFAALAVVFLCQEARNLGTSNAVRDLRASPQMWVEPSVAFGGALEPMKNNEAYLTFVTANDNHVFAAIRYEDGSDYWIVRLPRDKLGPMRVFHAN